MSWRDLGDEAFIGVLSRPARLALTTFGIALGLAAVVATFGLAQTAASQVAEHFDQAAATRVSIAARSGGTSPSGQEIALAAIPWDAEQRVERLNGVVAAGTISRVGEPRPVRTVPVVDPTGDNEVSLPLMGASPGYLDAVSGRVVTGRSFDGQHDARSDRVVVLGANAAKRLHINRVDEQPAVFIDDEPFTVIGIIDDVTSRTELLDAVIIPQSTARDVFGLKAPEQIQIETDLGAAQLVGRQAPIALDPIHPEGFDADVPPTLGQLGDDVESDVNALFIVLGGVALLAGAVGIANVTLLAVLERVGEIGLRRALGATRRQIAMQFLAESGFVGLLGGVFGASAGVLVTLGVSVLREWTPILDLRLAIAAPAFGMVLGVLSGTYPAWKASAVEPIAALRA